MLMVWGALCKTITGMDAGDEPPRMGSRRVLHSAPHTDDPHPLSHNLIAEHKKHGAQQA